MSRAGAARLATAADRREVAALLARAFADDPAVAYIYPDPVLRERLLPRLLALIYDSDGRAGMRLAVAAPAVADGAERIPRIAAASLWRAPGRAVVGWGETLRRALPLLAALRGATARALRVGEAIDAHMPPDGGWYLHFLGSDPALRGRGWGAAAVRAGLERVAGRSTCWLETANEANLGFYAALGFRVTAEWRVAEDGPRFWSLQRPADAA